MNSKQSLNSSNGAPLIGAIEAFASIGVGRTRAYQILNAGTVLAVKLGSRTLIRASEWERYLADLPGYLPATAKSNEAA